MNMIATIPDRFDPRGPDDADELARALATSLTGTSDVVVDYEHALSDWFGAAHAVTISSGSSAVLTALAALGLSPGDEVLLTPTAPLCTVYPIMALRLVPVFCDTGPDGFSIDLDDAASAMSARTRAVIDVPMWGYPVPADGVAAFARRHELHFVLDLAHGHGTAFEGRPLWSYAEAGTFSTHSSKVLSTGEGGFLLTDDPAVAQAARLYSRFGNLNGADFGMNHKLGGLQAALGLSRLRRLRADIAARRRNMAALTEALDNPDVEALPVCPGGEPNGLTLILRDTRGRGDALVRHMVANGIPSDIDRYGCRPLYRFPILADRARPCPKAERLLSSMTTVPIHPDLTAADLDRMAEVVRAYRSPGHA